MVFASRMRRNRDDGYFLFAGAVEPKYAVGGGRVVFRVGLEYLFAAGA